MRSFLFCLPVLLLLSCEKNADDSGNAFASDWSDIAIDRPWAGEAYWLNPLQAWRQKDGKLRCEISGGDRNAVLLTRALSDSLSGFSMRVDIEGIHTAAGQEKAGEDQDQQATSGALPAGLNAAGWVGFQVGLQGQFGDYRDDAVKGIGLCAGLTTDAKLFIGDLSKAAAMDFPVPHEFTLQLTATPATGEMYGLTLTCFSPSGTPLAEMEADVHASWLTGLTALTCSQSTPDTLDFSAGRPVYTDQRELNKSTGGQTTFAFSNWRLSGEKVTRHDDRAYGPILWAQYTLSDQVMKMSAQLAPVGNGPKEAVLFVDGQEALRSSIDPDGNNALFKIAGWDETRDHPYRIEYPDPAGKTHAYEGTIRKNPDADALKLASMSCVDDRGFPHQDLVDNVSSHRPDLYVFHGDQLYERVGGYGTDWNSKLDYLRKWYLFGWSFGDLLRNTPAIIIPDDHDVFHGNLWGAGGKAADVSLGYGYDSQDSGGYKEPPDFVNMVHRTQTGHLPDPADPTPVLQGISVYYTNMDYGGVSLAILGDRQWKSAPKPLLPDAEIENGWPQNRSWNAKTQAFHPDAELLGPRQEDFLEQWVADWRPGIAFKTVISQSPFCNVATLPADIYHDKYVPTLPRYRKGEYPPDDRPVADFDSNGWPQNKRNKAVRTMRKAFALHIAGDQHLGSTGRYGVDAFGDGCYWVATPAVSNLWPRRWFPALPGQGGKEPGDTRRYTGNYEDGFGNKITVRAVANPYDIDREPSMVFDKAPGYTIVEFDKAERTIAIAVWPRWASPTQPAPDNTPYEGWPIMIRQLDNYGRATAGNLPPMEVDGKEAVQVFNQATGELIYALRPPAGSFTPFVFDREGIYLVKRLKPDGSVMTIGDLKVG